MGRRFDIDDQRGAICAFGLICLAIELVGYYVTGKVPPTGFTAVFATLAGGPWVSYTWQKAIERKEDDDPPDPPPPKSQPDGTAEAPPSSGPPRKRKARGLSKCEPLGAW